MVDARRLRRLLQRIADDLAFLGERADANRSSVGFGNVLVRGYVDVDDGRVLGFLDRLDDLRSFVREVAAFIEA